MDAKSFIISAVVMIVLLCVAFGVRALIRKRRKKKGTFIDIQKKSKLLKNSMLVLIIITFGIGVYSVLLPKYPYSHWFDDGNPSAQMANSNLRRYAGRVRGSEVKDLLSYAGELNAHLVYPKKLSLRSSVTGATTANEIKINTTYTLNDNAYYLVQLVDSDSDGYYDQIKLSGLGFASDD